MSSTDNGKTPERKDNSLEQQFIGEQETVFQKLLRLQQELEEQGQQVAMALKPIIEALDTGGNVPLEMMQHVKAQILRAHLQLDDVKQVLDAMD